MDKIAQARAKLEARAAERHAHERAEYEAKLAAREAKIAATGNASRSPQQPGGKPPQPPVPGTSIGNKAPNFSAR